MIFHISPIFSWFQIPLLSKNDSTVTIMKDETTPVWREDFSTIQCYLNENNLAGQLTRRELPFSREFLAISFIRKNLLNMARSMYVCGHTVSAKYASWRTDLTNLGPSTPLYISEDVFPAENQREVHIIRFVCDVSCLYICIQTNMSEFCPLEYICLKQKTNQNILYNVIDYTGIQLAMEMNISLFSHRD